jgi:Fe-S-cluster containining protein
MGDRCSGQCCREFSLTGKGFTPDEIRAYLRDKGGSEGAQIADLLIPIRPIVAGTSAADGSVYQDTPAGGGWLFGCIHHDPTTGNCGIYETRPRHMCGAYPYGSPCAHKDCTWDLGRSGAWPLSFVRRDWTSDRSVQRMHLRVVQPSGAKDQQASLRLARGDEPTVTRLAAELPASALPAPGA